MLRLSPALAGLARSTVNAEHRAQERVDEVCRAGGLVNAPHVGQAIASALASEGMFDHELLKEDWYSIDINPLVQVEGVMSIKVAL